MQIVRSIWSEWWLQYYDIRRNFRGIYIWKHVELEVASVVYVVAPSLVSGYCELHYRTFSLLLSLGFLSLSSSLSLFHY